MDLYKKEKKTMNASSFSKERLPQIKKEYPFLELSDKFALTNALLRVDTAFQNFFDGRARYPKPAAKMKPSGCSYTTNYTNGNIKLLMEDAPYIQLPKVGKIRIVLPKGRTLEDLVPEGAVLRSATVKTDRTGFTVSILIETVVEKPAAMKKVHASDILTADMGLKTFATLYRTAGTEKIENPRWIRRHAKKLRRLQKSLSRKQYDKEKHRGSKNWEKAAKKVAKEQRKCTNQRKDFHHKLSREIAKSCKVFCCEDLNIAGMKKNRHLSKEISSVGWGNFLTMVKYKMERSGGIFFKVDRWFASSQICSQCGYRNSEVKDLSVREWTCPQCGAVHDRDENAGENMFAECIRLLEEQGIRVTGIKEKKTA